MKADQRISYFESSAQTSSPVWPTTGMPGGPGRSILRGVKKADGSLFPTIFREITHDLSGKPAHRGGVMPLGSNLPTSFL
jgi:hypothetical protein